MNWFFELIDPIVWWIDEHDVLYHIGRFLAIFCLLLCPLPFIVGIVQNNLAYVYAAGGGFLVGLLGLIMRWLFKPTQHRPEPIKDGKTEYTDYMLW